MAKPRTDRKPGDLTVSSCSYGFGYIRKSWLALIAETEGAGKGEDPGHVHRMRVASRRLRAAMPIFKSCFPPEKYRKWRKEIKNITASLGEARDLDVQIAFLEEYLGEMAGETGKGRPPGFPETGPEDVSALLHLLQQKRDQVQPAVGAVGSALRKGGVLDGFGAVLASSSEGEFGTGKRKALHLVAQKTISSRIADLLSYEPFVHDAGAVTRHHEMRIAAKRLRYTLETFSGFYSDALRPSLRQVRALQDVLGQVHDCDVWIGYLPMVLQGLHTRDPDHTGELCMPVDRHPGISGLLEDRKRERARLYREFVEMWEGLRNGGFFEALEELAAHPPPGSDRQ
ncbi:MAG: CHAD domain-containing protein [Methanomicrobiales archaeon]|nr:CHAD domain-containing protein [Methanomicrobiales archaeon]